MNTLYGPDCLPEINKFRMPMCIRAASKRDIFNFIKHDDYFEISLCCLMNYISKTFYYVFGIIFPFNKYAQSLGDIIAYFTKQLVPMK